MVIPGKMLYGDAVRTTINKNGRQIVAAEGTANTTVVYAGGDQTVHGHALDTTLNGGYQYVHNGRYSTSLLLTVTAGRLSRKVVWRFHHR